MAKLNIWNNPLMFWLTYMRLPTVGFAVAALAAYKYHKHQSINSVQKLCIATILFNALMIPMWPDRWAQYSTIPLALLIIDHYINHNRKQKAIWQITIAMAYTAMYISLWFLLATKMFAI